MPLIDAATAEMAAKGISDIRPAYSLILALCRLYHQSIGYKIDDPKIEP